MTKAPKKASSEETGTTTTTTTTRKRTKKNVDQTTGTNGRSLIIVESPAKAKTINKYLGRDYVVEASIGHIKNLPKSKIGVDIDGGFIPEYETIKGKDEVIERLRRMAASCSEVYLATDPDREGEAIAWHIAREIHDLKSSVYRVLFHEITERGIAEAMQHPHRIDENLVVSQQARRVMDRLVGYKVSPFIWKTLFYGLSAGRVQSVALRLVAEREEAISSFVPEEYWSMIGEFAAPRGEPFLARLFKVREEDPHISSAEEADELSRAIRQSSFSVADVQRKDVRRNPPPPFITSTLQQEAAKRLRYHAKRTMMLAQKLYEGIELGPEGRVGLITYMRTDSTTLAQVAIEAARDLVREEYGGA